MTDAGFFKGTSTEQDARFSDKKKKLMKTMKFGENLSQKVDMSRVNLDCIKPWIIKRVTELLNFEDEVVWDYVLNQLDERYPDPKEIQINITGFLNSKNARIFLSELWDLLLSAMQDPDGVPATLIEAKKMEIAGRQVDEKQVQMEIRRKQEELKTRAATAEATSVSSASIEQSGLLSRVIPNGSKTESVSNQPRMGQSNEVKGARSGSSSSGKEAGGRKTSMSDKCDGPRRCYKEKRVNRSRSSSNDSYEDRRDRDRSRQRHRSSSSEAVSKKPLAPESDWRKDLMAGRRRSPPAMPENSYYGYEKRRKDRKRSRRRHSSDSESEYRRSHHSHSRGSRLSGDSFSRRPHEEESKSYRSYVHRSGKHRKHIESLDDPNRHFHVRQSKPASRSPTLIAPDHKNSADRVNRFHDRRAQWAQEEDELRLYEVPESSDAQTKQKASGDPKHRAESTIKPWTSECPNLPHPPKEFSKTQRTLQQQHQESQSTTSTSDSESVSSSSDGDDEDSSSSSDSKSVDSEDTLQVPEGPSLPPSSELPSDEPEGPALPPVYTPAQSESKKSPTGSTSASSDASDSDSDTDDSESSSSSSDSGESGNSSSETNDAKNMEGPSKPKRKRSAELQPERREILPEGPRLPSGYVSEQSSPHDRSDSGYRKSPERQYRRSKREDSAEALRRRALASLIQASGRRRHRDSRSP